MNHANFLDKSIKLLAITDGRDKIYKFLAGVFKILATIAARNNDPNVKAFAAVGNSIASARSLMRMGRFLGDFTKMQYISKVVSAQGVHNTELKMFIEFFRSLGNALYIMGDNAAFIAKHRLIAADPKAITKNAKLAQFWGFFLAAVLDCFNLRDAIRKLEYDPPSSKKAAKNAVLSLTKDFSDVLVTMAAVGYLGSVWHPSGLTTGALTAVSGGIATYLNWNKIN